MAVYRTSRIIGSGHYNGIGSSYTTPWYRNSNRFTTTLTGNDNAIGTESDFEKDALLVSISMLTGGYTTYMTSNDLDETAGNNGFTWFDENSSDYPLANADVYILCGYAIFHQVQSSAGEEMITMYGYNHLNGIPTGATLTNRSGTWTRTVGTDATNNSNLSLASQKAALYRFIPITEGGGQTIFGENQSEFEPIYMRRTSTYSSEAPMVKPPVLTVLNFLEKRFGSQLDSGVGTTSSGAGILRYEDVILIHYSSRAAIPGINWTAYFRHKCKRPDGNVHNYNYITEGSGGPTGTATLTINHGEAYSQFFSLNPKEYVAEQEFIVPPNGSIKVIPAISNTYTSSYAIPASYLSNGFPEYSFESGGTETDVDKSNSPGKAFVIKPLHTQEHFRVTQKFSFYNRGGERLSYVYKHRGFALGGEGTQKRTATFPSSVWGTTESSMDTNKQTISNVVVLGDDYVELNLTLRGMPDDYEDNSSFKKGSTLIRTTGTGLTNCTLLDSHIGWGDINLTGDNSLTTLNPIRILPNPGVTTWSAQIYVDVGVSLHRVDISGTFGSDYGLQVFDEQGRSSLNSQTRHVKTLYAAEGSGTSTIGTATVPELAGLVNDGSWHFSIATTGTRVNASFNYTNKSVDILDVDLGNLSGQAQSYMPDKTNWKLMIFRK